MEEENSNCHTVFFVRTFVNRNQIIVPLQRQNENRENTRARGKNISHVHQEKLPHVGKSFLN